ncbi:ABC transporter permease, partial [Shinella sumterensis]
MNSPVQSGRTDAPEARVSLRSLLVRPEFTAIAGTIAVFAFFAIFTGDAGFLSMAMTRNYLEVAATIGIIAAPITLLLVAGEFDLSVGATVAAGEIVMSYLIVYAGWPVAPAFLATVIVAIGIGALNGYLVVKTKLPSFIITLATLFIIRGAVQGILRMLNGNSVIDGVRSAAGEDPLVWLFSGMVGPFSVSLIWWIVITGLAAWVLESTVFG